MSYKIEAVSVFEKQLKRLFKKYPSIKKDVLEVVDLLENNPILGTPLGNNCYKIRVKISSKSKGKSSGARIITYVYYDIETVYLLSIYDKSEIGNISDKVLSSILKLIK